MKVLVLSAHPDDEILGVGGTICKHIRNGDEVFVCIVTKAYKPEWSNAYIKNKVIEQESVDELIGIKRRINLNLSTVKLNKIAHGKLNKMIMNVVKTVNPNIVYTHYINDLNLDHRLVFESTLVALRPPRRVKLYCYETLSETEWHIHSFHPNYYVDIKDFLEKKIKAFEIYESESKKYPHPRSRKGIKILAKKRGLEYFLEYAESFIMIKDFWI
ncbi:MAG: PIG-L family deacetylase [Candidatus Lokiarchaeota archaeon]|nr:PIG-L family deacetylase [Candidatus Lokiarchaeota archaeon]